MSHLFRFSDQIMFIGSPTSSLFAGSSGNIYRVGPKKLAKASFLVHTIGAMSRKILIGVAWPYVNGDLHIGHLAGYLLPADICARFHRVIGDEVLMVSGSDCFGTPITVEADKKHKLPSEIVDEYHEKDVHLFKNILGLTYDLYTKTATDHHIK